jgi:16S rRNA (cytosine967-C5)-methyltransferase
MPRMAEKDSRSEAARVLRRWQAEGEFVEKLLLEVDLDPAFVAEIVYGVLRFQIQLDWMISRLCPRVPSNRLKPWLHVGLYQLFYMDRVPPYAAINETVNAARSDVAKSGVGFINGVLRSADRKRDELLELMAEQNDRIRFAHPNWFVRQWRGQFGPEVAATIMEWNNHRPDLQLRLRKGLAVSSFLESLGHPAHPHPRFPERMVILDEGMPVREIPGFPEGEFYVQDASTIVPADLLAPQPGEEVLDACAAPGGKTIQLAESMEGRGRLLAIEKFDRRLARLSENLERMDQSWVETLCGDFLNLPNSQLFPENHPGFDAILLDVPCSNSGVLRRRPESRWKNMEKEIPQLVPLQLRLLDRAAGALRPGGRIVYSTCSICEDENQSVVQQFLESQPSFTLSAEHLTIPGVQESDGGYAALLTSS